VGRPQRHRREIDDENNAVLSFKNAALTVVGNKGRRWSSDPITVPQGGTMQALDYQPKAAHNLRSVRVLGHEWSGIQVQAIHINGLSGRSWHGLDGDQPTLSIVVNEVGGLCDARPALHDVGTRRRSRRFGAGHVSLIPAGFSVWGYSENIEKVEEVRLALRTDGMKAVLGDEFDSISLQEPRLTFYDDSLQALARLLSDCESAESSRTLFIDSVVAAMVARISNLNSRSSPGRHFLD
jgi:AraC family transcriptional regulator